MLTKLLKKTLLLIMMSITTSLAYAQTPSLPIISGIGGNFEALNGKNKTIEFDSFKGKTVIIAFGYTNCADICPFTLGYLKQLYGLLTLEEQQQTQVIFITIDPKYDTPEHLQEFVSFFHKDFIGLSGSPEQIKTITSLYQAEYQLLSNEGSVNTKEIRRVTPKKTDDEHEKGDLFSHTVILYLIDKKGQTRSLEYTGTPKEEFITKIRILINE